MFSELRDTRIYGLRPARVLPETIDSHLQEAAFATLSRRRLLRAVSSESSEADEVSVASIRRQEDLLRLHLTGLASVWSARLEQRLGLLLQDPGELIELTFVAAFLLLRCARLRWEPVIIGAWQKAADVKSRELLMEAMTLAGRDDGRLHAQLATRPTAPSEQHIDRLMAQVAREGSEVNPQTARELARYAPQLLCTLTRSALRCGAPVCQVQLDTLAAMLPCAPSESESDFALLTAALAQPRYSCGVARALWLTGRSRAADIYLRLTSEHGDESVRVLAARGFELVTGLQVARTEDPEDGGVRFAIDMAAARYAKLRPLSRFAEPALDGRPRDTAALVAAAEGMLLREWHALLALIVSRSRGEVFISSQQFFSVQLQELTLLQQRCDQLLFVDPKGADAHATACAIPHSLGAGQAP